jgi:hypothetical protein
MLVEVVVFLALLASGTLLRLLLQDLPNFAPVAAIAMFAGFFFRSALVAALLPLAIMVLSDYWIGGYAPQMMLLVYGMLALPVAFRSFARRAFEGTRRSPAKAFGWLLAGSFVASVLFFLATNFGAWLWFNMYDHTAAGLIECYAAALPFYRYTLAGDTFFALALFGGYTWAWSAGLAPRHLPQPAA